MVVKSIHRSVDLVNSVKKALATNQLISRTDRVLISISGGQDSICLLVILNHLYSQMELHLGLVWCHHLWQIDSFSLMRQMTKISFLFQLNSCFAITPHFVFSELLARNWRHNCNYRICSFYNYYKISLAHSANDKVETILLNLMRGTGVTGLSPLNWENKKSENYIQKEENISQFFTISIPIFFWSPFFLSQQNVNRINTGFSHRRIKNIRKKNFYVHKPVLQLENFNKYLIGMSPFRRCFLFISKPAISEEAEQSIINDTKDRVPWIVERIELKNNKNKPLTLDIAKQRQEYKTFQELCSSKKINSKKWFDFVSYAFAKACSTSLKKIRRNLTSQYSLQKEIDYVDNIVALKNPKDLSEAALLFMTLLTLQSNVDNVKKECKELPKPHTTNFTLLNTFGRCFEYTLTKQGNRFLTSFLECTQFHKQLVPALSCTFYASNICLGSCLLGGSFFVITFGDLKSKNIALKSKISPQCEQCQGPWLLQIRKTKSLFLTFALTPLECSLNPLGAADNTLTPSLFAVALTSSMLESAPRGFKEHSNGVKVLSATPRGLHRPEVKNQCFVPNIAKQCQKTDQLKSKVPKNNCSTIRPLLSLNRFEIKKLCIFWKLPIYPDKSNQKVHFLRNRVRKQLLPTIKLFFNSRIENVLLQFAELFSAENHYMNRITNQLFKNFFREKIPASLTYVFRIANSFENLHVALFSQSPEKDCNAMFLLSMKPPRGLKKIIPKDNVNIFYICLESCPLGGSFFFITFDDLKSKNIVNIASQCEQSEQCAEIEMSKTEARTLHNNVRDSFQKRVYFKEQSRQYKSKAEEYDKVKFQKNLHKVTDFKSRLKAQRKKAALQVLQKAQKNLDILTLRYCSEGPIKIISRFCLPLKATFWVWNRKICTTKTLNNSPKRKVFLMPVFDQCEEPRQTFQGSSMFTAPLGCFVTSYNLEKQGLLNPMTPLECSLNPLGADSNMEDVKATANSEGVKVLSAAPRGFKEHSNGVKVLGAASLNIVTSTRLMSVIDVHMKNSTQPPKHYFYKTDCNLPLYRSLTLCSGFQGSCGFDEIGDLTESSCKNSIAWRFSQKLRKSREALLCEICKTKGFKKRRDFKKLASKEVVRPVTLVKSNISKSKVLKTQGTLLSTFSQALFHKVHAPSTLWYELGKYKDFGIPSSFTSRYPKYRQKDTIIFYRNVLESNISNEKKIDIIFTHKFLIKFEKFDMKKKDIYWPLLISFLPQALQRRFVKLFLVNQNQTQVRYSQIEYFLAITRKLFL